MTNRKRHWILTMPLAAALVAATAIPAAAAPAAPSFSATLTADAACQLTATATWKNAKVAHIYVTWWEVGYQSPDYPTIPEFIATSEWPAAFNGGVAKGKTVTFAFGPVGTDATSHDWRAMVSFYDAAGVALPQVTAYLTTNCYLPSPA